MNIPWIPDHQTQLSGQGFPPKRLPIADELDRTPVHSTLLRIPKHSRMRDTQNLPRFAIAAEPAVEVAQPEDDLLLVSVGEKYDMPPWCMLPMLVVLVIWIQCSTFADRRGRAPLMSLPARPWVLLPPEHVSQVLHSSPALKHKGSYTCFLGPLLALRLL